MGSGNALWPIQLFYFPHELRDWSRLVGLQVETRMLLIPKSDLQIEISIYNTRIVISVYCWTHWFSLTLFCVFSLLLLLVFSLRWQGGGTIQVPLCCRYVYFILHIRILMLYCSVFSFNYEHGGKVDQLSILCKRPFIWVVSFHLFIPSLSSHSTETVLCFLQKKWPKKPKTF